MDHKSTRTLKIENLVSSSLKVHISNVFFLLIQGQNSILSPKMGLPDVGQF
jgi:hypothetical protein